MRDNAITLVDWLIDEEKSKIDKLMKSKVVDSKVQKILYTEQLKLYQMIEKLEAVKYLINI